MYIVILIGLWILGAAIGFLFHGTLQSAVVGLVCGILVSFTWKYILIGIIKLLQVIIYPFYKWEEHRRNPFK